MKKAFKRAGFLMLAATLTMVSPTVSFGQQKEKKPQKNLLHARLFLRTDSTAEGYLMNFVNHGGMYNKSQINTLDSLIRLQRLDAKLFAKDIRYNFREIDSMYTWRETMPQLRMKWAPMMINKAYGNETPVIPNHLVMMMQVFRGRHVDGYIGIDDIIGNRIYYRTKDMDLAKAIHRASGKLTDKRKGTLRDEFADFPSMVEFINGLGKVDLDETPLVILQQLDNVLDGTK